MSSFTLAGNWKRLRHLLHPGRFSARERAEIKMATRRNGAIAVAAMRKRIRAGGYTANAALTTLIKGSTKPLVDQGQLFQAITYKLVKWDTVFVGILKQAKSKTGAYLSDIAELIHDGTNGKTIPVTPEMRAMFKYLSLVSKGKLPESQLRGRAAEIWHRIGGGGKTQIEPLRASTTKIRIPKRPFMRDTFEDPALMVAVQANWRKAADKALTGK